jgi:hypothetical protein
VAVFVLQGVCSPRCLFSNESVAAALIVVSRRFCSLSVVFFVRVNQVLVRLWARVIRSAVRCGVVGSPATDHRSLIIDSAVRLMSDRESVSGVATPLLGVLQPGHAPKSDSEGSEACCVN